MKRIFTAVLLVAATSAFAQDAQDLDRRVRALEEKIQQMQKSQPSTELDELRREIDVLSREIESLKTRETKTAAVADTPQYGLGVAASKVYRADQGVSFGGYGEFTYRRVEGAPAEADLLRGVLYTGYKFSDRALFNSELEVEDASTERGGNVNMEFAYLDFLHRPAANIRAGLVLVPMGLINEQHEPTAYLGARRPLTEQVIIPATWSELGAGVFGDSGKFSYRSYLMTGLVGDEFTGEEGVREGRQGGGNAVAEKLAAVGRIDLHPFEGTMVGGSLYGGDVARIGELHVDSRFRGTSVRGVIARGSARNAGLNTSADDPIGSRFGGWYVEGGYDLGAMMKQTSWSLTPYARYERVDTQRRMFAGVPRNPENDRRIFTLGLAFKPLAQTILKVDWENVENRARTGADRVNVSLGYIF